MKYFAPLISLFVLVALVPWATAQELALQPVEGALLLRNGNVMQGNAIRAGDFYVVTLGSSGDIRLPAQDVEFFGADMAAVYAFKQAKLDGKLATYLDLSEWCLRQRMLAEATNQLVAAMKLDPEHPRVKSIERRLTNASEAASPPAAKAPEVKPVVTPEELEETLQKLPAGSYEKFSSTIQPIVTNRCGMGGCHGGLSPSSYQLQRLPLGQAASRRFTERNLFATLKLVDHEKPGESPLLTMSMRRHGGATAASLDKRSQKALLEMQEWIRLVARKQPASAVETIPPANSRLSQSLRQSQSLAAEDKTATSSEATASDGQSDAAALEEPPSTENTGPRLPSATPLQSPKLGNTKIQPWKGTPKPPETKVGFTPKDPYDPEIFNRKYHPEK